MANQSSYKCSIASEEDKERAESTIDQIGNNLVELDLEASYECWEYWLDGVNFFDRVLRKCPNLQTLRISSGISPNSMFGIVGQTQQQLEDLSILCLRGLNDQEERVNESSAVGLARRLKRLQSFQVNGVDWNCTTIDGFLRNAKKLESFQCEIIGCDFELDKEFLEEFHSSEDSLDMVNASVVEFYGDTYEGEADFWGQT